MESMCYKCEKEVKDEDDYAECDGCDSLFHLKCCGVTKKEAKAREKSKCLKLYCPECFKAKNEGTPAKLKEILGLLYKIDLCTQEQKTSIEQKLSASIESKLNALDKKINSVPVNTNNTKHRQQRQMSTREVSNRPSLSNRKQNNKVQKHLMIFRRMFRKTK